LNVVMVSERVKGGLVKFSRRTTYGPHSLVVSKNEFQK